MAAPTSNHAYAFSYPGAEHTVHRIPHNHQSTCPATADLKPEKKKPGSESFRFGRDSECNDGEGLALFVELALGLDRL
jgi:hypothetical protein